MLNIIKNIFSSPSTPDVIGGNDYEIDISGIKLLFKQPKGTFQLSQNIHYEKSYNLENNATFHSLYKESDKPYHDLTDIKVRAIYGGYLNFDNGMIGTTITIRTENSYQNLFKPEELEDAIEDFLNVYYGPNSLKGHRGRRYECPLFWQTKTFNNLKYISFFVNERWNTHGNYCLTIPISKKHYLNFNFGIKSMDYDAGMELQIEKFIDDFMSHVYIKFPASNLNDSTPDLSNQVYSESRSSLSWDIYDTDPLRFYSKQEMLAFEDKLEKIKFAIDKNMPKYSQLSKRENHKEEFSEHFDIEKEKQYLIQHKKMISDSDNYYIDKEKRVKVKIVNDFNRE